MKQFKVGKFNLGEESPCFIVAEVGVNHNGDIELAKRMIDLAAKAGVQAVKFQTFKAAEFVANKQETYSYVSQGKPVTESMYDMFVRYELRTEHFTELKRICDSAGVLFFSTPQNVSDLESLLAIGLPMIKVGSDDLDNIPLMKNYASRGLPMVISTGMSYLAEIDETVRAIEETGNKQLAILHCVSSYPATPAEANIRRIKTLKRNFPDYIIGFSDHTETHTCAVGAVTLGAKLIEKHFTLDHNLPGPDHRFSLNPEQLKGLVREIRDLESALGTSRIQPSKAEVEMRGICRRSVVAFRNISAGEVLTTEVLACKRPGGGLPPKFIEQIVGAVALNDIPENQQIKLTDLKFKAD